MGALLRFLRRAGIERGLLEGRRSWLWLGGFAWGLHFLSRAAGRSEVVVYREELAPGESVVIRREAVPAAARRRKNKVS
jgi:hypothetical protein